MKGTKFTYQLGREENFIFGDRYFLQTAERAMGGDVMRGIVELITNADDSYADIEETSKAEKINGEILVSVERRRKTHNSIVKILDFAEGMNLEEMVGKLRRVGSITSRYMETRGRRARGLMGRGSKECVVFGPLRYQSIKNGKYSEIHLKQPAIFKAVDYRDATEFDRVELGIATGNGTLVTMEVQPRYKFPTQDFFIKNLPRYYSLRAITASPKRKLFFIDLSNHKEKKFSLQYEPKDGSVILDEVFHIPGYSKAEAHLVLKKVKDKIKTEPNSFYWEGGVLVQSGYAIHEVTGFTRDIENNPHFEHYIGHLTCQYIDDLTIDYEIISEQGSPHSPENPVRIIDPERYGLAHTHPFTKSLYNECAYRIKDLLKKDEEAERTGLREIENKKTTERLKRLASEVSKFIRERTEAQDIFEDDNYLDPSEIPAGGVAIIPQGAKIPLLSEKRFYVYAKVSPQHIEKHVVINSDSENIIVYPDKLGLVDRGDGVLSNNFTVKGVEIGKANVEVFWGSAQTILSIKVVKKESQIIELPEFSFAKMAYAVKEGKRKDILILAKWPEFVHGSVGVEITTTDQDFIKIVNPRVTLKYKKLGEGVTAAVGIVKIFGNKVGGPVILQTTLQQKTITTKVRVAPALPPGKNITIQVVDEDLGEQRAVWDSNLLKISGRHPSVRRYLGSPESGFPGQDFIHFRMLMAELIADNVARRILELNAQKDIRAYENMDITAFYRLHRKHMNDFLEVAHKIQIPESELHNRSN